MSPARNKLERQVKAELWFIAALCFTAVAAGPLSLCSVLRPDEELLATWFQRSGAITSIFSVLAQYLMSNSKESVRGETFAESWWLYYLFKTRHLALSWVIAIVTIWGAIVWGYGDLLINHVLKLH